MNTRHGLIIWIEFELNYSILVHCILLKLSSESEVAYGLTKKRTWSKFSGNSPILVLCIIYNRFYFFTKECYLWAWSNLQQQKGRKEQKSDPAYNLVPQFLSVLYIIV